MDLSDFKNIRPRMALAAGVHTQVDKVKGFRHMPHAT